MKIDFSTPIRGIDETIVKQMDKEGQPDFTLREVAVNSLLTETKESAALDGMEKVRQFRMADRIYGCKEPIEVPDADRELLKALIGKIYGRIAVTRAWDILDGKTEPAPAAE
jgi:hypothetical protein